MNIIGLLNNKSSFNTQLSFLDQTVTRDSKKIATNYYSLKNDISQIIKDNSSQMSVSYVKASNYHLIKGNIPTANDDIKLAYHYNPDNPTKLSILPKVNVIV